MTVVDCKIEIPDGYELAEPLPRRANKGDIRWTPGWTVPSTWTLAPKSDSKYFILIKSWQWPEWLTAD